MKIERLVAALMVINLVLLGLVLADARSTTAQGVPPVLRARALEIVDDRGRVRASIKIEPANPTVLMPTGTPYPETVLLRLIDPNGRPGVKLAASEHGSGLSFVGEADRTHVILKAEGAISSLKLSSKDGREQLLTP